MKMEDHQIEKKVVKEKGLLYKNRYLGHRSSSHTAPCILKTILENNASQYCFLQVPSVYT